MKGSAAKALAAVSLLWLLGTCVTQADATPRAACVRLAGEAVTWLEPSSRGSWTARLAAVTAHGLRLTTTIGAGAGEPSCPALAEAGAHAVAVTAISPAHAGSTTPGQIWVATLGRPKATHLYGALPAVGIDESGEGLIAWLADDGPGADGGPTFSLDGALLSASEEPGAAVALAPAGTDTAPIAGEPDRFPQLVPPAVSVAADGSATIAWSTAIEEGSNSRVQIVQDDPAHAFQPPETVYQGTPGTVGPRVSQLLLAANGSVERVQWAFAGKGLGLAGREGAQPFTALSTPFAYNSFPREPEPFGLAVDGEGETVEALTTQAVEPNLVVLRSPPGKPAAVEEEAHSSNRERIGQAALAVRNDGEAALAWIRRAYGRGGGQVAQVWLSTAMPGRGFSLPRAVTPIATLAGEVALAYRSDGQLQLIWTGSARLNEPTGELHAVTDPRAVPSPNSDDWLDMQASPGRGSGRVRIRMTARRAAYARVQAIIAGLPAIAVDGLTEPEGGQANLSPEAAGLPACLRRLGPGRPAVCELSITPNLEAARLALAEHPLPPGALNVRVVGYATSAAGESTVVTSTARIGR